MTRRLQRSAVAYGFLLLGLGLYLFFVLRPTVEVFALALFDWDGINPQRTFVGLDNFARILGDAKAWAALGNNLRWLVLIVAFNVTVGMVTAAVLAQRIRGRLLFQLAFFLPVVQAPIVVAMIWRWMYNPEGVINFGLRAVGLGGIAHGWLGDPDWALPALALATCWAGFGLSVVIFLAGLQGVDATLYDAARIDGANGRQVFRYVTVPALRNVITVVILLEIIGGFQVFDIIWGTTQGGPLRSTEMLATYMYKRGVQSLEYGYGAAVAVILMILVLLFAVVSTALRERGER